MSWVVNMMLVLSSPLRTAVERAMTKKRVMLLTLSSILLKHRLMLCGYFFNL